MRTCTIYDFFDGIGNFFNGIFTVIEVIIIIAIVIGAIAIIYKIIKKVQATAEANRKTNEYVNNMKTNYNRLSRQSQVEIYRKLIEYNNHKRNASISDNRAKNSASYGNRDGVMNGLIGAMAGHMLADDCLKTIKQKYGIVVKEAYIKYDIEYLKKLTGQ